jgi:hypothetical protein
MTASSVIRNNLQFSATTVFVPMHPYNPERRCVSEDRLFTREVWSMLSTVQNSCTVECGLITT